MKRIITVLLAMLPFLAQAQQQVQMADTFRSEGKIYVVVLVILTIFIGIIIWLTALGKKISKLEKDQ